MRVSSCSAYLLSSHSSPETTSVERRPAKGPVRSLQCVAQAEDSRDDVDVPFLANYDADVVESLLPSDFDVDDDVEVAFLLLSLYELRGEESLPRVHENRTGDEDASRPSSAAALRDLSTSPSLPSTIRPCVRFVPELVTSVKEIPSHRSFTDEEKRSVYRGKRALAKEAEQRCLEIEFERSLRCIENVLEEDAFLFNQFGELIHPVHWVAFKRDVLPRFARNPFVPRGFSSLSDYQLAVSAYNRFYKKAVLENVFPEPES